MPKLRMTLEAEVQLVLDELWSEKLIPFALNVGKISKDIGEYTIHFHDSRIYSASVTLSTDRPLRDVVRSSVLARVKELSGPWNWPPGRAEADQPRPVVKNSCINHNGAPGTF